MLEIMPITIKETICSLDPDQLDHSHAYLMPIMCGLGKSTAVSLLVKQNLYAGSKGILILTDRKENFSAYTNPRDDEEFLEMLRSGGIFDITEMTAENIRSTRIEQKKAPVLIACTQRLFQSSDSDINELIRWNGGDRPLIIIDEKPPLLKAVELSLERFSAAGDAISQFSPAEEEAEQRNWCENQWNRIKTAIIKTYRQIEQECSSLSQFTCYLPLIPGLPEDAARFTAFVQKYQDYFRSEHVLDTITCGIRLIKEGGLITCRRDPARKKANFAFHMLLDQRDKVINRAALTIILDGTGDVSPEYKQDYITIPEERCFTRDLSKLHIILVNVPTSKQNLQEKEDKNAYALAMKEFLNKYHGVDEKKVIFTYKDPHGKADIEHAFQSVFGEKNVNHFGNIKGSNEYKDARIVAQFGLFQFPPVYYLQLYLNKHPEEYAAIKTMKPLEAAQYLGQLQYQNSEYREIVDYSLMADIEQNFFRSKIRMADNEDEIFFYLFMNLSAHQNLIRLIKERYGQLNAVIDDSNADTPEEFTFAKAMNYQAADDQQTQLQQVRRWIDSLQPQRKNGKVRFTTEQLCRENSLSLKQFSSLRKKYPTMMAGCTEIDRGGWEKKGVFSGIRKRKNQ